MLRYFSSNTPFTMDEKVLDDVIDLASSENEPEVSEMQELNEAPSIDVPDLTQDSVSKVKSFRGKRRERNVNFTQRTKQESVSDYGVPVPATPYNKGNSINFQNG